MRRIELTHKFEVTKKNKLDNPQRRMMLPPEETLRKLGLEEGAIMADIGCGIGYFTIPAGQIIGMKGKVYALDIAGEMLQEVDEAKKRNNLTNIETVKVAEYDLKLETALVSFAFTCNVLHEIDDLDRFCGEIKRIMADKGRLAVVEWEKKVSNLGPPIEHRLDKAELIELFKKHQFELLDCQNIRGEHYSVIMEKL
jgi:ubiquinone/menaquinone biosynthesis C-methylase UbiE